MTIRPLPVPTRPFDGENLNSYAARHTRRNATTIDHIERALRQDGTMANTTMRSPPERLNAWRQLGRLHSSAFTTLGSIHGQPVLERPLCLRCTNGEAAIGRLPATGWVCIRHRRWIKAQQCDIRALPELLAAERHFRRVLAPRGVLADAPAMRLARDCAGVDIKLDVLTQRAERAGTDITDMLLYPETVKIARLITRPAIQARLADHDSAPTAAEPSSPQKSRHSQHAQTQADNGAQPQGLKTGSAHSHATPTSTGQSKNYGFANSSETTQLGTVSPELAISHVGVANKTETGHLLA